MTTAHPGRCRGWSPAALVVIALVAILVVFQPASRDRWRSAPRRARARQAPRRARVHRRAAGSCPTSQPPALPAGETRTVTLTTPKGAIVDQGRGRPVADRRRQLRRAGLVRLLRRDRLPPDADPPGRHAVRHPGRRSRRHRDGRPRLHDHRTSRSRRRTSAARSRWPGQPAPNSVGSQFFIVLDDKDGAILSVGQHVPDHRQRHVRHGRRRCDLRRLGRRRAPGRTRSRSRRRPSPTPDPATESKRSPRDPRHHRHRPRRHRGRAVRPERPEGDRQLRQARRQRLLRRRRLPPRHPGLRRPGRRRPVRQEVVARARAASAPAVPATSSRTSRSRATTSAARWRWPTPARTPTARSSSSATRT